MIDRVSPRLRPLAAPALVTPPGPLTGRLAFVAQRDGLRRSVETPGPRLERFLARLEEAERAARRARPCLRLRGLGGRRAA